jgi:hypothetical protein
VAPGDNIHWPPNPQILSWVLLAGAVLGIAGLVLGALIARTSQFGNAAIVVASVAPVLGQFISF